MYEILEKKLSEKISLTDDEFNLAKTFFIPKKLRKKQYLLQEGDVCKYLAFVEKGILRSYSVDEKGNEHVIQFALEGWWIADSYSLLTGEPSGYNIDALEDAELLLLSHASNEMLFDKIPKFERYFRFLMQNNMIALQRRLLGSLSQSAEEKYIRLSQAYPDIIQRVPQHLIASYLGVTPETLSRIRKQMSLRK
jgi:CRP-like cAMP-binding protein